MVSGQPASTIYLNSQGGQMDDDIACNSYIPFDSAGYAVERSNEFTIPAQLQRSAPIPGADG